MKNLLLISLLLILPSLVYAANVKTGDLPDVSPGQTTDQILVTRSGTTANVIESTLPGLILPGSSTQIPILNGGTGYNFPHWYPALNNVIHNVSNATICAVGDSTTFGVGSNGSVAAGQNFPQAAYPTQLANLLMTRYGVEANSNSFMGDGTTITNYGSSDSRITLGSSWTQSTDFISLGLDTFKSSTNTNNLSFLPTSSVDTFTIYYIINSSNGVLSAKINSGSATTQDTSVGSNNSIGSFTITGTLASNTINLTWSSGGPVYVVGVVSYDSSKKWVNVINMGAPGSLTTQWAVTTNSYSPANAAAYQALGCNLIIDDLGINDTNGGTSVPNFIAAMTAIFSAQQAANADVVGMVPAPPNTSFTTQANINAIFNALRMLILNDGLPLVDITNRWISYTNAANNRWYTDTYVHSNATGYADYANVVLSVVMPTNLTSFPAGGQPVVPLALTIASGSNTNAEAVLSLANTTSSFYTIEALNGTGRSWDFVVGNSAAASLANDFFIQDRTTFVDPIIINTSDQVGISSTGTCPATDTLGVCGNIILTGHLYQNGSSASNANGYLETFVGGAGASQTNLNPGIQLFGGQNATQLFSADLGYNSTSTRFRTRLTVPTSADISFATHTNGVAPTSQSSLTDKMVIRGDTGFVGIGTPSPSSLLALVSSTTGIVETQTNTSGTCTHTPGSSSETVSCSSDRKFKENITSPSFFSAWLWDFPVREYTLKSTGERVIGVVAQELQKVHPEMVHENVDANGEAFLTVDAPNIWRLVRAIQELQAFATFVCLIALLAAIWHFVHYHHHHRKKRDAS